MIASIRNPSEIKRKDSNPCTEITVDIFIAVRSETQKATQTPAHMHKHSKVTNYVTSAQTGRNKSHILSYTIALLYLDQWELLERLKTDR